MIDLAEAAAAIGGDLAGRAIALRVQTDSREIVPGDLFVALKGERFDGHHFVDAALAAGAVCVLVARDRGLSARPGRALWRVDDPLRALGELAAWWRKRFDIPLIAITGSNGKTTVKEMVASILGVATGDPARVLATQGNFNNEIGLPLTLLRLNPMHTHAVCEMGMSHPGELARLTRLARPTIALVNNAAAAHLEGVGTTEDVARAKAEIYEGLGPGAVAIVNADDPFAALWRQCNAGRRTLEFGFSAGADVHGRSLPGEENAIAIGGMVATFQVRLAVAGRHNASNALAAAAAALAAGIEPPAIVAGLGRFRGVDGRLQLKSGVGGARVIDDTYNANPASTTAAIEVLRQLPGQRWLVLGDMRELGPEGPKLHRDIGAFARRAGVDRIFAFGDLGGEVVAGFGSGAERFTEIGALIERVRAGMSVSTTVLVKGSRSMRMERVVEGIVPPGELR